MKFTNKQNRHPIRQRQTFSSSHHIILLSIIYE